MEGIKKVENGYYVNGVYVSRFSQLWHHTWSRIDGFEQKCKNREDFVNKMVTRLKRIKDEAKIYYTIAVLVERGYHDVAEIYDSRLVMNALSDELDFLDEL